MPIYKQDYEGKDPGCYKEQCFSGNPKKINTLVQSIQTSTKNKWGYEDERSQAIYGSETLQNGRNFYLTRSHSKKRFFNFIRPQRSIQPYFSPFNILKFTGGTTYTYWGMPFDLNDAQWLFTQIMKKHVMVIREIWRIRCVVYLNDLLLLHQDKNYFLFLILFISLSNKRSFFILITSFSNTSCVFFYLVDTLKFTKNIIYETSDYYYHFIIFIFIIIGNDFSMMML
jgi:hypothetical protein